MSENAIAYQDLIPVLKQALRRKGLRYRDLARHLSLSESGIKKIFLGKDCSFNRVVEIARALDLTLEELILEASQPKPKSIGFSEKAERFLTENFDHFEFFWLLYYERKSVESIKADLKINEKQARKYLRKLDSLGLIELHPGDRIKLSRVEFGYFAHGSLLKLMKEKWAPKIVADGMSTQENENRFFTFYYMRLNDESFLNLSRDLVSLFKAYTRETVRNVNLDNLNTRDFRVLSCVVPGSFIEKTRNRNER